LRALDAGPLDELRKKYGAETGAAGFLYHSHVRPSILFKPKTGSRPEETVQAGTGLSGHREASGYHGT
jgi:hypothetical protein